MLSASPFWVPQPLLNGKIVLLPASLPSLHVSLPASARLRVTEREKIIARVRIKGKIMIS